MEAPPLERRLAAILVADVEGYNRLMHGEEAMMAMCRTIAFSSTPHGLVSG